MSLTSGKDTLLSNDLLPPEVWYRICSFLPKSSLASLRLVCSKLGSIALPECFKTIYIETYRESTHRRLSEIAKSPKLRNYVRRITLDASNSPDFDINVESSLNARENFLLTLPYLSFLRRLTSLCIRFRSQCTMESPAPDSDLTWSYRYVVLDTIYHCVAGMWTMEKQAIIDANAGFAHTGLGPDDDGWWPDRNKFNPGLDDLNQQAIPLRQLIVTNMADYHDPRLNASEAFKKVISMPSIRDLRLHVISQRDNQHPTRADFSSPFSRAKYEFFAGLPISWLTPDITGNLRVLTLHCREFWGWCPKMDFCRFNFPHLKALSFDGYVFTHNWQIDWIGGVGQRNGGLEELYLHDCPILYEATQMGPFDTSNPGYPLTESVLSQNGNRYTQEFPIRWHTVLSRWAKVLGKLKVFYMGRSTYQDRQREIFTRKPKDFEETALRYRLWYDLQETLMSPCPSGPVVHQSAGSACSSKAQLSSINFNQHRDFQMKYIKYDIRRQHDNGTWPWGDPERRGAEAWAPEEYTLMRDDAAYEMLMDAVEARAGFGVCI
ncbi:hypothetical protein F53441_137 [Fusarium austroafricanum]|uniref:F-box domain-containing protein n=1 Tax=Fusarium austroafricanum TaxID=2364996 RepID=A0A8H4KVJ4_9HYPO|nr:hypothetical protein F53441_137 [Fusarium austroafricanum]